MDHPKAHKKRREHAKKQASSLNMLLAEYDVVKEIGRGGFSVVYEGRRKGSPATPVAIKVTPTATYTGCMGIERYQLDLRLNRLWHLLREINNQNLVNWISWTVSDTDIFAFLELYNGGDLFSRIINGTDGHLSEEDAKDAARSLLGAVADLHASGIIHRDIKPENCWFPSKLSPARDIVLGDLGVAIIDAGDCLYIGMAGSAGYISPEMKANKPYNKATDIWSLGVLCYEILVGRSPVIADDDTEFVGPVPFPKQFWAGISPAAQDFVRHMLELDQEKRWTAEELLDHPWLRMPVSRRTSRTSTSSSVSSSASSDLFGSPLERMRSSDASIFDSPSEAEDLPQALADFCLGADAPQSPRSSKPVFILD